MEGMRKYTVYMITNVVNGKIYIGAHASYDENDSYMGSGLQITRAHKKYGIDNFTKQILFVFDNEQDMYEKEKELVDLAFVERKDTYNMKLGGQGGVSYTKASDETRKKMREAKLGKARVFKEGWVSPLKGVPSNRKASEETREKQRKAKLGKTLSKEHKEKISNSIKGKVITEEHKKALSKLWKGKKRDPATIEKMKLSLSRVPSKQCVYCGGEFSPSPFSRWHGENCKMRKG